MKPFKTVLLAAIIPALLLSSCSIEKRRYRKGYYIDAGVVMPKTVARDKPIAMPDEPEEQSPPLSLSASAEPVTKEYWIYVVVGTRPDKKAVQSKHKPR